MISADGQQLAEVETQGKATSSPGISHSAKVFDPVIQSAHWLTLLLIACTFTIAALIDEAPSDAAKLILVQLHRSLGLTIWTLTVFRLIWRQFAQLPDWPANMPRSIRIASSFVEYLLYGLLLVQPVLGLLYTNARGNQAHLFFLIHIPALIDQDQELSKKLIAAHEFVAKVLLAVIVLHAAVALYHHLIRRDNTLNRMLPKALRSEPRQEWHL